MKSRTGNLPRPLNRVIHITTVHSRSDTRIRLKEVATLAMELDANVQLFVQDGEGDEFDGAAGYRVVDTGPGYTSRSLRMTAGAWRMYRAVRAARPDVVHFHDPELIPICLLLKLSGMRVIYDVHEDVPRQLLSKGYLPRPLQRTASVLVSLLERLAASVVDGIIPATPAIAEHFPAPISTVVQNFPLKGEMDLLGTTVYASRPPHFGYVGTITPIRGVAEVIRALPLLPAEARLQLAGVFRPESLREEITALEGWSRVDFAGWADRHGIAELLGQVRAGLVLFHPLPNHICAQPNKLFEYMAAGIPVIASNFPLWREIVEGAGAGLLVDPLAPHAIAEAMRWILDHPSEAEEMGRRGRQAVRERYNWDREGERLVSFYRSLLGEPEGGSAGEGEVTTAVTA